MRRRDVLAGFMIALAAPRIVAAQPRKIHRIGVLGLLSGDGRHVRPAPSPAIRSSPRSCGASSELDSGVQRALRHRAARGRRSRRALPGLRGGARPGAVNVIVAVAASLPALKQATTTIPIVMAGYPDPVGLGFMQSLGRPGGNITGLSLPSIELTAKRLELLKELVPTAAVVAVLWDEAKPSRVGGGRWRRAIRGWKLLSLEIRDAGDIEAAFKTAKAARAGSLLAAAGGVVPQFRHVTELAAGHRLPSCGGRVFVAAPGERVSYTAGISSMSGNGPLDLRGSDPQGAQAGRPSRRAAVQARAGHQPRCLRRRWAWRFRRRSAAGRPPRSGDAPLATTVRCGDDGLPARERGRDREGGVQEGDGERPRRGRQPAVAELEREDQHRADGQHRRTVTGEARATPIWLM